MRPRFLLCLLLIAPPAAAQEPQYAETVEVRLHNLDAVVTDRDGKPVTGLTKEDFVVLEDGVPQPITNFSVYESSVSTMSAAESPAAAAPAAAPVPSERTAPPRRFVFFIDDMSIQASARATLKKHALSLVRVMRPGDLAAIVRPNGAARMAQEYTSDAAAVEKDLMRAIDDCKIRLTAPAFRELQNLRRALEHADSPSAVHAAKRAYADAARGRVEMRLGQIRALITSMAANEGKKILVLITSGLSAQPGREAYSFDEQVGLFEAPKQEGLSDDEQLDVDDIASLHPLPRLRLDVKEAKRAQAGKVWAGMDKAKVTDFRTIIDNIARTAAAEGITIYALEPEVPLMTDVTRGADSKTLGSTLPGVDLHVDAQKVVPGEMLSQLLQYGAETLTSMTEKTGGRWFRGISSIDDTFRQVTTDLEIYYSLAYRAKPGAKPRKIKVEVRNRPELIVRTRTEVIDHSTARDMADRVIAGLLSPGEVNDLTMTVKTERPQKKGRAYIVPVEIVIPVTKIAFRRSTDGKYRARVSVHYATAREEKEFASYGRQEQIIELTERQFAELAKIRYRYTSNITVPRGKIRIALGVLDTSSKLASLQTLHVTAN